MIPPGLSLVFGLIKLVLKKQKEKIMAKKVAWIEWLKQSSTIRGIIVLAGLVGWGVSPEEAEMWVGVVAALGYAVYNVLRNDSVQKAKDTLFGDKGFARVLLFPVLLAFMLLVLAGVAAADSFTDASGGDLTESDWVTNGTDSYYIDFIWTDSNGNGVSNQLIQVPAALNDFFVYSLEPDPGSTTPDADYDVTVTKVLSGIDVFQGGCEGLDGTDTTADPCFPSSGYVSLGGEDLYFTAANQGTSSAICKYRLWLLK